MFVKKMASYSICSVVLLLRDDRSWKHAKAKQKIQHETKFRSAFRIGNYVHNL